LGSQVSRKHKAKPNYLLHIHTPPNMLRSSLHPTFTAKLRAKNEWQRRNRGVTPTRSAEEIFAHSSEFHLL
jgi:hypothetical protein